MLNGALTPYIKDYVLVIKYEITEADDDDDFEIFERVLDELIINTTKGIQDLVEPKTSKTALKPAVSLFNAETQNGVEFHAAQNEPDAKYSHFPKIKAPRYLQSPPRIPPLFPFFRSIIFVALYDSESACRTKPILLKSTSAQRPLNWRYLSLNYSKREPRYTN